MKRYEISHIDEATATMEENNSGEWVLFKDHISETDRQQGFIINLQSALSERDRIIFELARKLIDGEK